MERQALLQSYHTPSFNLSSYANRAKNIKNQPRINEDPKDALLRKFQEEIERLKGQLGGKGKGGRRSRRHRNADGTEGYDDDNGDQDDEELFLKEQQDKLNEEKRSIQQKKNINGSFARREFLPLEKPTSICRNRA